MEMPSKRVLSVFILVGALVASSIIGFGRDKGTKVINLTENLVPGKKVSLPTNSKWQEELGAVGSSLNPKQLEVKEELEENTTDKVSKTILSNYLALKQSGNLNQNTAQSLLNTTINGVGTIQTTKFSSSKLNIIPDNGKVTIESYGENLGMALRINRPSKIKNEIELLTEIMKLSDPSKLSELDPIILTYENLEKSLVAMPVPQKFVEAHLDIVRGINGMGQSLKDFKKVFEDPIVGVQALGLYQQSATLFNQAITATIEYIVKNGVIYKQGSNGYYLLHGI